MNMHLNVAYRRQETQVMWKKKTEAEDMRLVEKNGVPYFVFKNLENTGLVRHGFSTRLGESVRAF